MKEVLISIKYLSFTDAELSGMDKMLVEAAKEATKLSYSPYSNFKVGAAVLLDNGLIVKGSNQENGAYSSCMCAERTALNYANSEYPAAKVVGVAVAAAVGSQFTQQSTTPCGCCRQVILETEIRNNFKINILLYGETEVLKLNGIQSLLPFPFQLTE